jgi:hypothetical protein
MEKNNNVKYLRITLTVPTPKTKSYDFLNLCALVNMVATRPPQWMTPVTLHRTPFHLLHRTILPINVAQ